MRYPRLLAVMVILFILSTTESKDWRTREKRDVQKKFGFFGGIIEVGRLAYDQYRDTKGTLRKVLDMVNNSFSDTATKPPPGATTPEPDPDAETTTEPYRISRAELGKILNRNLRGLQKLLRIELNDAWNQTKYSVADYKKEYQDSIRKSKASATTQVPSSSEE